jgi:ribosome maturation factor RimP
MNIVEQIENRLEEITKEKNLLLIDFHWRGTDSFRVLEIFVDNVEGITTEICSEVSREIESFIDEAGLIKGKYRLDVSSPGVGKPLKYIEQFPKHIGRSFKLQLISGDDNVEKIEGKLTAVNGDELVFEVDGKERLINFKNIKQAKVQISF